MAIALLSALAGRVGWRTFLRCSHQVFLDVSDLSLDQDIPDDWEDGSSGSRGRHQFTKHR